MVAVGVGSFLWGGLVVLICGKESCGLTILCVNNGNTNLAQLLKVQWPCCILKLCSTKLGRIVRRCTRPVVGSVQYLVVTASASLSK